MSCSSGCRFSRTHTRYGRSAPGCQSFLGDKQIANRGKTLLRFSHHYFAAEDKAMLMERWRMDIMVWKLQVEKKEHWSRASKPACLFSLCSLWLAIVLVTWLNFSLNTLFYIINLYNRFLL